MKKAVSLVLTIILLLSLYVTPVLALEQAQFELVPPDGTIGEEIEISLNIRNNPGITAFSVNIHYPAEQLQLLSASGRNSFAGGFSTGRIGTNPFKISWYNTSSLDVYENGTAAVIRFRVLALSTAIITLTYDEDDVFNSGFDNQYFAVKPAVISNHTHTPVQPVRENETAATCTEPGYYEEVVYCSACEAEISRESVYTQALGHDYLHAVRCENLPTDDGNQACVYYTCGRGCGAYFQADYNSALGQYFPNENAPVQMRVEDIINTAQQKIPCPTFNSFYDTQIKYAYDFRGASLRCSSQAYYAGNTDTQSMRYCASVKVPDGIEYQVGSQEDDVVLDFGYVFSQEGYINDVSDLVLGEKNIYSMSVVENNSSVSGGIGKWKGVTCHAVKEAEKTVRYLTFNLIIDISAKNWNKNYVSRAYITYKHHGMTYTVYDGGAVIGASGRTYYSENVYHLAGLIVNSSTEMQGVKNYCQKKIIDSYDLWSVL